MKERHIAIVLALFLGSIGAHAFYLGQWKSGILFILFSWTGIPFILGVIAAIRYARMSDEAFSALRQGNHIPASSSPSPSLPRSEDPLHKKPENLSDVLAGLRATWQDPESRKRILKKVFRKNIGDL